ncbi:hypothetical protein [Loktanella sp. IMCC34160]|uniref:hypothetical protein n=1 Tax=Loktanella sp. IMCC34160 TaxID=2510646 RepID=UPI001F5DA27E|nr:hypothetical protein [Loktanella sp. IMCC34160]
MKVRSIILVAMAIIGIAVLGVWQFAPSTFDQARGLMDGERLDLLIARAGIWGPVLIVTLMTLAVVASPIPSAPIALAAGAAYGHFWGTVQVVIGAELGALIAFETPQNIVETAPYQPKLKRYVSRLQRQSLSAPASVNN